MTKAAVHTTIRELSMQISRREAQQRRHAWNRDNTHRDPDSKEWKFLPEPDRNALTMTIKDLDHEADYLRIALAKLSDCVGRGLL